MARTSTFPILDKLLDGRLVDLLNEWRGEGLSNPEIARRLNDETGVIVSTETIRRWFMENVEPEQAAG